MTDLDEKAQETPDIDLARQSAPGAYVLDGKELSAGDDLTPEGDFPEYGDFLPVRRAHRGEDGIEATGDRRWIECPQALAKWLVETGLDVGDGFRIKTVQKVDGRWDYDCEELAE